MKLYQSNNPLTIRHKPSAKVLPAFTLIELLIVMAILGILTVLGVSNFNSARIKARDAKRKSDLQTISKSLEAYVNDHGSYPVSDAGELSCTLPATCAWGEPFTDANGTIYSATLPAEDRADRSYYYSSSGTNYTLYAALENDRDPAYDADLVLENIPCGETPCNYKITSTNIN